MIEEKENNSNENLDQDSQSDANQGFSDRQHLSSEADVVRLNQSERSLNEEDKPVKSTDLYDHQKDVELNSPRAVNAEHDKVADDKREGSHSPAEQSDKTTSATSNNVFEAQPSKSKKNGRFLTFISLGFAGVFVIFIFLMVLVIAKGGDSSPILKAFGLDPNGIKSFLLTIVNFSFSVLAIVFFVIGLIGVFKGLFAKKDDRQARKKGLWMTIIGIVPLVMILFTWLFLFNLIGDIQIVAEQVKAEILVTRPTDLTNLEAPLEVTFSSENVIKSLQNKKLPIKGVQWDLNADGTFETTANDFEISYLYQNKGNYRVGLAVEIEGESAPRTYFFPLLIQQAAFEATPATGTPPLEIQFDATQLISSQVKVKSLDWDFNEDGTYEISGKDALKPRYTFEKVGTFKVHLRLVDDNNLVQNYYRDIEITKADQPLVSANIELTPSATGSAPMSVLFDGGNSQSLKGKIISYEWDFGDGSDLQSGRSVSHVFNSIGNYKVSLKVKDDVNQEGSSSVEIKVTEASSAPKAIIKTNPLPVDGKLSGELPFAVSFDASASSDQNNDIVDYEWTFDKNKTAQGAKANFTFETVGIYNVQLKVIDADQQEDISTLQVEVLEPGVRALINAEPEEGTAPLNVRFDGSTSSTFNGNIVAYEWDFGDGSPKSITGARITHRYEQVGTYNVRLKVTTNNNESAEYKKTIFVREIPLRACFTPSRSSGVAPVSITFDSNCTTGSIAKYKWDFGDGKESESRKPAHNFESPGSYNVTLEVFDDKNNVSTFSEVVTVEPKE